jgi:cyclic pyranopterin monophosphate synthase
MRDISRKSSSLRVARAEATLKTLPSTLALVRQGKIPKGDPLEVSRVAAIQAAKDTSRIIPYCHPLPLDHVKVEFALGKDSIGVAVTVKAIHKTGVEMEALTAASVAALTLYDMLKMLDQSMEIENLRLVEKTGGKSDFAVETAGSVKAAVLVISDSVAGKSRKDASGRKIVERMKAEGLEVLELRVVPDEPGQVEEALTEFADKLKADLVLTTGGTGLGPRDTTPEATSGVLEREAPGIVESLRAHGTERTPFAMLSRGMAGVRGQTLIVNLPGSARAVEESLDALFPAALHAVSMLRGGGHSHGNKRKK